MRCAPVRALTWALGTTLVAGLLLALPTAPVSAGPGPDSLFIAAGPTGDTAYSGTYEDGQKLYIRVNINEGDTDVFQATLETDKSGSYQPITGQINKTTSSYGKYTFTYTPTGEQNLRATWVQEGVTRYSEVLHLTPVVPPTVTPTGPDTGNLYQSPTTFDEGDKIKLTANFPSGSFSISLYKETDQDVWSLVEKKPSNSSGNADFLDFPVTGTQRVFARKTNNDRTEVDLISPTPKLSIRRDCTGNDCSSTATAYGELDPAQEGQVFKLQRQSGTSWVSVTGASPATTGADGKVEIQFPLAGIPQWTARVYRLTSVGASPAVTSSHTISFMPGPNQLGPNVLRVDVEGGKFPTSKGPEYPAKATASQNGDVNAIIDNFAVEDFGVRGTSTAGYTKKPYKLKFENSPRDTTVFGMGADKSWTLLASFLDQSFVREKIGLDLGRRLNAHDDGSAGNRWTPDSRFVELFVNDQYRGSYLMTESVKIDRDRVDISSKQGMIMEVDNALSSAIDFLSSRQIVFAFKDPDERKTGDEVEEGVTDAKVTAIRNRINAFEAKLYSSSGRDEYKDFIDEEAAVDFNLIKEFTKDNDADFNSSHYFSWDQKIDTTAPLNPLQDGRFHFGPAWDFDRSAGNVDPDTAGHTYVSSPNGWMLRGTGTPSDSGRQLYRTHWFVQLFKDEGFKAAVKARWAVVRDEFQKVGASEVATLKDAIGVGAANDRNRWASEPKRYRSHGTFSQEIAWVTDWYKKRFTWMDGQLS